MQSSTHSLPCTSHFQATLFTRHNRSIRAISTESQAWFCLTDLARLMGQTLGERSVLKLDADQRRVVWLQAHGDWQKQLMVSELARLRCWFITMCRKTARCGSG